VSDSQLPMTRDEYDRWWMGWWTEQSEAPDLPPITVMLAAHVSALQERIDRLPHPDHPEPNEWITQCACAYDFPTAQCGVHRKEPAA
jgi:hypothetical protein